MHRELGSVSTRQERIATLAKQSPQMGFTSLAYLMDFVIGFTEEEDARRVLDVLPKRFGKYGLALHPEKTRLVPFQQPPHHVSGKGNGPEDQPGTFDLLGFTHYGGRSRKNRWVVMRKTASSRLTRAVRSIAQWCRRNRHQPISEQHRTISQKLRGHYAYYGITGNAAALANFRCAVARCWRKWLSRRNRQRGLVWALFNRLLERYPLPPPRVVHSVFVHAAKP